MAMGSEGEEVADGGGKEGVEFVFREDFEEGGFLGIVVCLEGGDEFHVWRFMGMLSWFHGIDGMCVEGELCIRGDVMFHALTGLGIANVLACEKRVPPCRRPSRPPPTPSTPSHHGHRFKTLL